MEAAKRFLEARERSPVGSEVWALATSEAFGVLKLQECDEVAKPEWWSDEGLKALSAKIVMLAPNDVGANAMRAEVLMGQCRTWEAGPHLAAGLKKAATYFERCAALHPAPAIKAELARYSPVSQTFTATRRRECKASVENHGHVLHAVTSALAAIGVPR